ncbi:MAG: TetR/AcrR family transcriptional regulator [Alphaproteobacteria bacterium]
MPVKSDLERFEIKDKTLCCAREFIINNGAKALTARKLAQENGYSVGTLYNLFNSLDDIVMNIAIGALSDLISNVTNSLMEIDEPELKLRTFSQELLRFIQTNPNLASLVFVDITNYCLELPEDYSAQINMLFAPVSDIFADVFPAIDDNARTKLSEVYASSLMGIIALASKNLLNTVCKDNPAIISELLFTMYAAGMKKLNSKSE